MNKYLPDNIDDFFSGQLKNYSEAPGENAWSEIDKRLPANKTTRRLLPAITGIGTAAMLLFCIVIPFFIKDNFMKANINIAVAGKKLSATSNDDQKVTSPPLSNTAATNDQFTGNIVNKQTGIPTSVQNPLVVNQPVAELPNTMNDNSEKNEHPGNLVTGNLPVDYLTQSNKVNEHAPESININLHNRHLFSLIPFFSVDHITGRFIEQYAFGNLDKNDLEGRENPDMSFTAGLLAGYQLNKKFSLVSGISYSSSKLSVAGAAVKALQNDNGAYIFKMATSYGFA